jgi:hypothetical protein
MTASGAVGDLDKTMKSFANQSRVMAEAWQQVKTYAGVVLTKIIENSGILVNVNAILIFIGDTLKAVAESMGAIQHFGGDIFESTTEGALGASEAIDQVQGKLLDFDKFRAMSGQEENALGLDEKLLQALSGYDTILGNASMKARELAENLKIASGLFNEDGTFNVEKWEKIKDTIVAIVEGIGLLIILLIGSKLTKGITSLATGFGKLNQSTAILYGVIGAFTALNTLIALLPEGAKKFASWASIIVGSLITVLGLILAIKNGAKYGIVGALMAGVGLGAIMAGINGIRKQSATEVKNFANGGLPDKGTLFRAGEAGAEIVYNTPSGQSGVVNVQQIQQAMYGALVQYGRTQGGNGQPIEVYLDGEKVYQNTTAHAKRRGNVWGRA